MERLMKGDVVVIPFPFTDLSNSKKRPAIILADIKGDDYLMVQITSKNIKDSYAIPINPSDVVNGIFNHNSNARPNKIFTLNKNIVSYKIGSLSDEKMEILINKVIEIITT